MCRLLILDNDKSERRFVAAAASARCDQVVETSALKEAAKVLRSGHTRPTLIVAVLEAGKQDALALLRLLHELGKHIPFVAIVAKGAEALAPRVQKLGACCLVHRPLGIQGLVQAMAQAIDSEAPSSVSMPHLANEELGANVSELVNRLNATMKCTIGKEQVFLHSFITDFGQTTQPRVTLRCHLRAQCGVDPYVYYEQIRDVCCAAPHKCEVLRAFAAQTGQHFPELERKEHDPES